MKTVSRLFIVIGFAFLLSHSTRACSCPFYIEHFCGIVNESHMIVRVQMMDTLPGFGYERRQIKILEELNKTISKDTVILIGQDGLNCGELLHQFETGDTLILALDKWWVDNSYYLEGRCGLHFLRYSKGKVFDNITPSTDTLDYNNFKNGLIECMALRTNTEEPEVGSEYQIFPNPVQNTLTIQSSSQQGIQRAELLSLDNRALFFENNSKAYEISWNVNAIDNGVYYLRIWIDGRMRIEKIVIMK